MKIDTNTIMKQYDDNLEYYRELESAVNSILRKAIKKNGIKIHSVDHRIKELSSLIGKARRKQIENPLEKLHDIVGFRVVCLFLSDLEKIEKIIHNEFKVFEKDDKINSTELNYFGYMSLHLKAYVSGNTKIIAKSEIQDIPFEIQVRTIAQDAWASISHYLDYKKERKIPDELKKDFHALSGLLYVADSHFSLIKQEQTKLFFANKTQ